MPLAIFALRQSAQPPRLKVPTPQRSDRFSLMQPEPSHPASFPMTSGQDKIAPPQLTTSRARNGRLRSFRRVSEHPILVMYGPASVPDAECSSMTSFLLSPGIRPKPWGRPFPDLAENFPDTPI